MNEPRNEHQAFMSQRDVIDLRAMRAKKPKHDDLEGYGQAPVDRVLPTMWLPINARLWLMSVDWFGVVRAIVMGVCIGSICAAFWPVLGQVVGGVVTILLP
jgi:hypothetical protein